MITIRRNITSALINVATSNQQSATLTTTPTKSTEPGYFISNYTGTEQTVLAGILILIMLLSLFGNGGMLAVLYTNDRMWNSTNILIGNLSVVAFLTTTLIMPFSMTSMVLMRWPFAEGPICKFNAFLTSQFLLYTIFIHTMISIDKYYAIVKPLSRAMTVRRTWISSFVLWTLAAFMSLGPLIHIGEYQYNKTALVCGVGFPEDRLDSIYMLVLFSIGFIIPNVVNAVVYLRVFTAVRQHTRRIEKTMSVSNRSSCNVMKLQRRLVLTTFTSLLCFLLCWTPFAIYVGMAITSKSISSIPHGLGVSAYWSGYMYNAVNPLIICSMSSRFGEGMYEIARNILNAPVSFFKERFFYKYWRQSSSNNIRKNPNTRAPFSETPLQMESLTSTSVAERRLDRTVSTSDPGFLISSASSSSSNMMLAMSTSSVEINLIPKSPMIASNQVTHETRVISTTHITLSTNNQ